MITTLLVLMLMSALLVGFTAVVMSDQRYRFIDRDRGQAFYAASGGVEKLTADLGNLFFATIAPTGTQVTALTATKPSITGVTYTATNAPTALPASSLSSYYCGPAPKTVTIVGGNGYTIMFCTDATGNPVATTTSPVKSGAYEGLIAAQTPYQIDVTARTATGGETHLIRTMEAVAIPVFQFGMFSDVDLSFFAGPNFDFGGRVHTNGNLFLSQGGGATLTLSDKVTAVKEIIRQQLQNGVSIDTASTHDGTVSMAKAPPTTFRNLARTEGSLVDGVGSAQNEPTWHTVSLSTYNSWIRNGRTGAKALNLPLITVGGTNPDLIRRPPAGENVSNPVLFAERLFSKSSIRILLSDTAADITNVPTVTATAPVQLDGNWNTAVPNNGTAYGPIDSSHPPIARTPGGATERRFAGHQNGGSGCGLTTLSVAVPAYFSLPATMTVTPSGAGAPQIVACTGKTATTFTGCTPALITVPAGATVTAAVNFTTASAVTTVNWVLGSTTITVAGGNTAAFSPNSFWVTNSNGTQSFVTCTGYLKTAEFDGCSAVGGTLDVSSNAMYLTDALSTAQTGTIGGHIKIEEQDANGAWTDITMQILNYGIGGSNLEGQVCADPTPNAILRIQRLRDNGGGTPTTNGGGCNYAGSVNASSYRPNVLFDAREGLQRDVAPAGANVILGGVMYYIAIDATNAANWFRGTAPYNTGTGTTARKDNGGFTVYFSGPPQQQKRGERRDRGIWVGGFCEPGLGYRRAEQRARRRRRPQRQRDARDLWWPAELQRRVRCATAGRSGAAHRNGVAAHESDARSGASEPVDHFPARAEAGQRQQHRRPRHQRTDGGGREPGLPSGRLEGNRAAPRRRRRRGSERRRCSTIRTWPRRLSPTRSRCCRATGTIRFRSRSHVWETGPA